jgi:hypothetical protein
MRRAAWIVALLGMAACNANPLLHEASANYDPIAVGDLWNYGGANGMLVTITGTQAYHGRPAYVADQVPNSTHVPALNYWSFAGGDWLQWDPTLNAWTLYRRLPYVTGNTWPIPSHQASVQIDTIVDGTENLSLASGYYANCFKLRTVTQSYAGGVTTTTQSVAWVAPGIGDVQYGFVDASGTTNVTTDLTAYQVH